MVTVEQALEELSAFAAKCLALIANQNAPNAIAEVDRFMRTPAFVFLQETTLGKRSLGDTVKDARDALWVGNNREARELLGSLVDSPKERGESEVAVQFQQVEALCRAGDFDAALRVLDRVDVSAFTSLTIGPFEGRMVSVQVALGHLRNWIVQGQNTKKNAAAWASRIAKSMR